MVECGSQHTVLLSEDHVSVYGWGSNAWGQLGCAAAQQEPVDMPSYARGQAAPQTDANVHPQHFSKPLKLLISSYGRVAKVQPVATLGMTRNSCGCFCRYLAGCTTL